MKRIWTTLAITLLVGLGCAYWVACAQDRGPLYPPPPVLPTDTKASRAPKTETPVSGKAAKKPPTLDAAPKALPPLPPLGTVELEPMPGVVQAGGVVAPPMFPPGPVVVKPKEVKEPSAPPHLPQSLPELDTKPLPTPEPTKALIVGLPTKEPAKPALPSPGLIVQPPTVVLPGASIVPPVVTMPDAKPKAFVRIRSGSSIPPAVSMPIERPPLVPPPPASVPPSLTPNTGALASVQTPSVSVEKRGAATLRAGQSQSYQIHIRNLGPTSAQQVRIDDELPVGVKLVSADPMPTLQGNKAVWILPNLPANGEQTLRLMLQSLTDLELSSRVTAQVSAANHTTTVAALRPRNDSGSIAVQLVAPPAIVVGTPAVFEIRVTNQSDQPVTGIVLHGSLPENLTTPQGRSIEGEVDATIAPGEVKTLRMPATVVKPGRGAVTIKVTARGGLEASATAEIDITGATLHLQQAPTTRMFLGRDGDLRIDVMNHTGKPLRNVTLIDRLPEGLDFVAASERGLYQANSRTVYWQFAELPAGSTKSLIVRVHGTKPGQLQNAVQIRSDGLADLNSVGIIQLEGVSDLNVRVTARDPLVEVGNETIYEIHVVNPGSAPATNVQVQVLFPPGLAPKNAQADTRFAIERNTLVFEPIASLAAQGQATFRVSAVAQPTADRDQRVRVAVASDQVRVPIQKEIGTMVVPR